MIPLLQGSWPPLTLSHAPPLRVRANQAMAWRPWPTSDMYRLEVPLCWHQGKEMKINAGCGTFAYQAMQQPSNAHLETNMLHCTMSLINKIIPWPCTTKVLGLAACIAHSALRHCCYVSLTPHPIPHAQLSSLLSCHYGEETTHVVVATGARCLAGRPCNVSLVHPTCHDLP